MLTKPKAISPNSNIADQLKAKADQLGDGAISNYD